MADLQIRFDNGTAYERMTGVWSRLAGEIFLAGRITYGARANAVKGRVPG
jgi:hypothetical protein